MLIVPPSSSKIALPPVAELVLSSVNTNGNEEGLAPTVVLGSL